MNLKTMFNSKTVKANVKVAGQALLWIGLGYVAGALLPELVLSRVTFLRQQAHKSEKHRAAIKAGLGLLILGPGVVFLASKLSKGAAAKATKYVLGGVALGAVGPLVVNVARTTVARIDQALPGQKALAAPGGYQAGAPVDVGNVIDMTPRIAAPGAMVFGPPDVSQAPIRRA